MSATTVITESTSATDSNSHLLEFWISINSEYLIVAYHQAWQSTAALEAIAIATVDKPKSQSKAKTSEPIILDTNKEVGMQSQSCLTLHAEGNIEVRPSKSVFPFHSTRQDLRTMSSRLPSIRPRAIIIQMERNLQAWTST